jgi:hypothetical protein
VREKLSLVDRECRFVLAGLHGRLECSRIAPEGVLVGSDLFLASAYQDFRSQSAPKVANGLVQNTPSGASFNRVTAGSLVDHSVFTGER